jgi:hypothetical protein
MSLLGMVLVNTFRAYWWMTYPDGIQKEEKQKQFYTNLSEELIDNTLDDRFQLQRKRNEMTDDDESPVMGRYGMARMGSGAHLTPTKSRKKKGMEQYHHLVNRVGVEYAKNAKQHGNVRSVWMIVPKKKKFGSVAPKLHQIVLQST